MLNIKERLARRKIEAANFHDEYLKKNNKETIDEVFHGALRQWREQNPLFSPEDRQLFGTATEAPQGQLPAQLPRPNLGTRQLPSGQGPQLQPAPQMPTPIPAPKQFQDRQGGAQGQIPPDAIRFLQQNARDPAVLKFFQEKYGVDPRQFLQQR